MQRKPFKNPRQYKFLLVAAEVLTTTFSIIKTDKKKNTSQKLLALAHAVNVLQVSGSCSISDHVRRVKGQNSSTSFTVRNLHEIYMKCHPE